MGLWQSLGEKIFGPRNDITSLTFDEWIALSAQAGGGRSASGVFVSPETSLRFTTVMICVRVLSESVASLPCILYKKRKDGGKDIADGEPLYNVLMGKTNGWNTPFEYFEGSMTNLTLRGNAYSYVDRNRLGQVQGLVPLNPDGVTIKQAKDWTPLYNVLMPDNTRADLNTPEMFHVRGPLPLGYVGRSMIALARDAIGLGMATEKFGSALFENGVRPSGILETTKSLTTPAQERLKTQFAQRHAGLENANKPLLLEEGMKWVAMSINPDDAQFLETRKFQRSEIAGIFRVPAHYVNDLENATFSNIEHQSLDFVMHSLRPWLVRWEQTISRDLIAPQDQANYCVEFDIDEIIRGDFLSRMNGYALMIQNRLATPNELRIKENMNPIKGGAQLVETNNIQAPAAKPAEPTGGGVPPDKKAA
jgi:HK97 family phage portal protein